MTFKYKTPATTTARTEMSAIYAELWTGCMVLKIAGIFLSLAIATSTLLTPGSKANSTELVAIVEQIVIKKENSENLLTSKATFNGVREFAITVGFIIPKVPQDTDK